MKEYYSRLFLKDGASKQEVKKAYRKLVKKFHPDKNIESNEYTEEFKMIQDAYERLMVHFDGQQVNEEPQTAPQPEPKRERSTEKGVVRSDAKFAEEGEEKITGFEIFIATIFFFGILSIPTMYVFTTNKGIVAQILVGSLIIVSAILFIYGAIYKNIFPLPNQK